MRPKTINKYLTASFLGQYKTGIITKKKRISAGGSFSNNAYKIYKCLEAKRRMLTKHRHGIGRINYVSKNYLSLLYMSNADGQHKMLSVKNVQI